MRNGLVLLAALTGCGGGSSGSDMKMQAACTDLSVDAMTYVGEAAGAIALTTGQIKKWYPDAYLFDIHGGLTTVPGGKTTAGLNGMGGQWVVSYYSPTAKHAFAGVFSTTVGHISCQDTTIAVVPHEQPDPPKMKSSAAMQAAVDVANFMLPMRAQSLDYGQKSINSGQPHDKVWLVDFSPLQVRVLVDDETGMAIECDNMGTSCL